MAEILKETIKSIVKKHLKEKNGLCFGQCLTAVGWVGGTLPELYEHDGMIELPTSDVMNSGVVVGAALMNRRPIYVIRYQGFNWLNASFIVNYAAKSKEMWNKPCPIFIRSVAMENAIGPVAGSSHASLYYRMPGIQIYGPMSSEEYQITYNKFMENDDVFYVSEHRGSYNNSESFINSLDSKCDITLCPISITRFEAEKAKIELEKLGYKIGIIHLFQLKPLDITDRQFELIKTSKYGSVILDDDYQNGIAKCIAYDIMFKTGKKAYLMCLEERTAGFHKSVDNLSPKCDQIVQYCLQIIKGKVN